MVQFSNGCDYSNGQSLSILKYDLQKVRISNVSRFRMEIFQIPFLLFSVGTIWLFSRGWVYACEGADQRKSVTSLRTAPYLRLSLSASVPFLVLSPSLGSKFLWLKTRAMPRRLWFMLYISASRSTGIRATFWWGRASTRPPLPKPHASFWNLETILFANTRP